MLNNYIACENMQSKHGARVVQWEHFVTSLLPVMQDSMFSDLIVINFLFLFYRIFERTVLGMMKQD